MCDVHVREINPQMQRTESRKVNYTYRYISNVNMNGSRVYKNVSFNLRSLMHLYPNKRVATQLNDEKFPCMVHFETNNSVTVCFLSCCVPPLIKSFFYNGELQVTQLRRSIVGYNIEEGIYRFNTVFNGCLTCALIASLNTSKSKCYKDLPFSKNYFYEKGGNYGKLDLVRH